MFKFQKRMLSKTFIIVFLFSPLLIFSINVSSSIDSLLMGKPDSVRFKIVKNEIRKYNYNNLPYRLKYSKLLLTIAQRLNTDIAKADAYYDLAYSYEIIGQLDLALDAGFKSLEYATKINDKRLIGFAFNEIGLIYSSGGSTEEYDFAISYFRKFLLIQQELNDIGEIAGAMSNIGLMYLFKEEQDSALYYAYKALELRRKINQKRTIPISLGNIGESLLTKEEMQDSALACFQEAIKYFQELDNSFGINGIYSGLINYYLNKKDFKNLKYYIDKQSEISKRINSMRVTKTVYLHKYQYYKALGDYDKALKEFELYKELFDSLRNDKINERIVNLQAVYDLNEKEKEIALYKEKEATQKQISENRKQRIIYLSIVAVLIVMVFIIISISLWRKRKQQKKIHEIENIAHQRERELAKSELEKSQIKEQELHIQLEYKSKQLTTHALNMMKKNQFLQELESDISEIRKEAGEEVKSKLRRINSLIKRNSKSEKDWSLFKNYFEEVNKGFYKRLNNRYSGLSSNELKLCALIKLNMNIKESASVLNVSPESVKTARYRLRKKMKLNQENDLHLVIQSV